MIRMRSRRMHAALLWSPTLVLLLGALPTIGAESAVLPAHSCAPNERWDNAMSMCMPASASGTAQTLVSGQFNVFGVFSVVPGPRGIEQFAVMELHPGTQVDHQRPVVGPLVAGRELRHDVQLLVDVEQLVAQPGEHDAPYERARHGRVEDVGILGEPDAQRLRIRQ